MSAPESTAAHRSAARTPPQARAGYPRLLCGWGRTNHSLAVVLRPRGTDELREAVLSAGGRGGLIARGAGLSYGDAAQNRGGLVLDLGEITGMELLDGPLLRAGAGATLAQALRRLATVGLTLPVVPGTRRITIGGAIAADVHGKNHRRDGSFGHHVQSVALCTPDGALREISRERDADLFDATLGGMGLTGVIVAASIRPRPLAAPVLDGDIDRTDSIEQAIAVMRDDERHRYSIAWVDLLARGAAFGRSVVLRCGERPPQGDGRVRLPGRPRLRVPDLVPTGTLRPALVASFNALRWHRAPARARRRPLAAGENLFPLDALGAWNHLYGASGLVQYQFAVPEDRAHAIPEIVEVLRRARQPMYLAVIKRFGSASGGMLSFPAPGWTLAIDLPAAAPGLRAALDAADAALLQAGGRIYLAKDARMAPEALPSMYPRLGRFEEVRRALDPQGLIRSDMGARLGLTTGAGS